MVWDFLKGGTLKKEKDLLKQIFKRDLIMGLQIKPGWNYFLNFRYII